MQSIRLKVYSIDGVTPVVHPLAFVHPEAVLIGDVIIEEGCYIGPCASLRGDFGRIIVRKGSNVQDNCTLHSTPGFDVLSGPMATSDMARSFTARSSAPTSSSA